MTEIMMNEIRAKMLQAGFEVSEIHTGSLTHSADGVVAEVIITDSSEQRFNVTVFQSE